MSFPAVVHWDEPDGHAELHTPPKQMLSKKPLSQVFEVVPSSYSPVVSGSIVLSILDEAVGAPKVTPCGTNDCNPRKVATNKAVGMRILLNINEN